MNLVPSWPLRVTGAGNDNFLGVMRMLALEDIRPFLKADARQTVPRHMVHRAALSEVFLAGGRKVDNVHFQCAAQLPRTNLYFNDIVSRDPYYDMALIVEVFRQASIYVSHAYLDVAETDKFLYLDSHTRTVEPSLLTVTNHPMNAIVDVRVVDEYVRRGVRQGATLDMSLFVDGKLAAIHDKMSIRWMNGDAWNRMREKGLSRLPNGVHSRCAPVRPAAAKSVGRHHVGNVVVGPLTPNATTNGSSTELVIPFDNGGIFDHPLDHIPGMLLLEGFRQSALQAADLSLGITPDRLVLTGCKLVFRQFGEFGFTSRCRLDEHALSLTDNGRSILCPQMVFEQEGDVIAAAALAFDVCFETVEAGTVPAMQVLEGVEP